MPLVYEPGEKKPRHKCKPPVEGGRHGSWIMAATPWDKDGRIPNGSIWECPEDGKFFLAHEWAPLLPGWDRVPAWYARRKAMSVHG